jgi:hypothetical protein
LTLSLRRSHNPPWPISSADPGNYPIEFGPSLNLKWRSAVRPGKSSPVWERQEALARHEAANDLSEPSASTPVTDGENVYVDGLSSCAIRNNQARAP